MELVFGLGTALRYSAAHRKKRASDGGDELYDAENVKNVLHKLLDASVGDRQEPQYPELPAVLVGSWQA